ncbi:thioesterase superfamily protein [Aliiroseovarius zhejiangensis]|uniref:Thioesterase superfamily protein n=1 Tax=Aliiroseovarius zhejiangensis TaxID=1632025 RepID=A0ABQ3IU14_9RHOB|nr:PaaI family thioesterase [Aliiroseovarius zhejiangensis]GHE92881.1 thioesterase superfamily protein [Aliiroseovarius zhejiangensis]
MPDLPPDIAAKVRQSFASQNLMTMIGAEMTGLSHGSCELSAPIPDTMRQQHGFGHAALTFGLGDTAAGYAALSVMPDDHEVLTSEIKINLLAPAAGDRLVAEGRVLRVGRRLIPVEADVWAEQDGQRILIAKLLGTMVPVPIRPAAT